MNMKDKNQKISKRKRRTRLKARSMTDLPRLSVFRSHKYIYAQIIDDNKRVTLVSASDNTLKTEEKPMRRAGLVGESLAKKALEKKIKKVYFDRGAYKYHGRVKSLAEGARSAGLKF